MYTVIWVIWSGLVLFKLFTLKIVVVQIRHIFLPESFCDHPWSWIQSHLETRPVYPWLELVLRDNCWRPRVSDSVPFGIELQFHVGLSLDPPSQRSLIPPYSVKYKENTIITTLICQPPSQTLQWFSSLTIQKLPLQVQEYTKIALKN